MIGRWTLYRNFQFDENSSELTASQMKRVTEMARYMKNNPSLTLGLDGEMDRHGLDTRNVDLRNHRVTAVHDALVEAGDRVGLGELRVRQFAPCSRPLWLQRCFCTAN